MKRLILLALLLCAPAMWAQPTNNPPLTGLISERGSNCTGFAPAATIGPWVFARAKILMSTCTTLGIDSYRGTGNAYMTYYTGAYMYPQHAYQYAYPMAIANGFSNPENLWLHAKIDNAPSGSLQYGDLFDLAEQNNNNIGPGAPATAINGIFTLVGSTYTDVTAASYTTGPGTVSDRLLIGLHIPFDTVNVGTVPTPRVGGSVSYQYWNGTTWAALPSVTDGTSGLTAAGATTFPPPSNWARHIVNGSQSKYWIQITVSGAGTNPVLGSIKGDTLLTGSNERGWQGCTGTGDSGGLNLSDPELAYCASPGTGHTAKFRQQARIVGNGSNKFSWNPGAIDVPSSKNMYGYLYQYIVSEMPNLSGLWTAGYNGLMFDNGAVMPNQAIFQGIANLTTNTDFCSPTNPCGSVSYSTWQAAAAAGFGVAHTLLTSTPKFWDGNNTIFSNDGPTESNLIPAGLAQSWMLSEGWLATEYTNDAYVQASLQAALCTDIRWCPTSGVGSNTNSTILYNMIAANVAYRYGLLVDGQSSPTFPTNYHLWDRAGRVPLLATTINALMGTGYSAIAFNPNGNGSSLSVFDDYYYWVDGGITTATNPVAAALCTTGSPCAVTLSVTPASVGAVCPTGWSAGCTLRIGHQDIVPVSNYTSTSLSLSNTGGYVEGIMGVGGTGTVPWPVGTTVEYLVQGHQSVDNPLNSPVYYYGTWFPIMGVRLGIPDSTNDGAGVFNAPCTGTYLATAHPAGCLWAIGTDISGNVPACNSTNCSKLLRRNFTGGDNGKAIVLLRTSSRANQITAASEYDTASQVICLHGGTASNGISPPCNSGPAYYPLNADRTFGAAVTQVTLRGGEAGIYVSQINVLGAGGTQFGPKIQIGPGGNQN